ncbi:integrase [Catenuloplanes nepalensis]|uniref:Integrase n=1 Tax=Catenuloplanes nepalensis TaxID=587533 RepID=A0ABT9MZI6_9ACTN|nr:integrase [Catenuloplanes nepalensis]
MSLLSDHGLSLEQIADLVGHAGTTVTGTVYRHQLRPVLLDGATAMDRIFGTVPVTQES